MRRRTPYARAQTANRAGVTGNTDSSGEKGDMVMVVVVVATGDVQAVFSWPVDGCDAASGSEVSSRVIAKPVGTLVLLAFLFLVDGRPVRSAKRVSRASSSERGWLLLLLRPAGGPESREASSGRPWIVASSPTDPRLSGTL